MTAATIQEWLLFKGGIYCNVVMIVTATIQKSGSFTVQITSFVIYYTVLLGTYIDKVIL